MCVWMLTGDKGTTAKEIGITCGLITPPSVHHQDGNTKISPEDAQPHDDCHTFEFKEVYSDAT
jgi:magnesium-transporting ATPase (P-type)